MIKNIQASFADKCSLKAARSTGKPQTYIDGGGGGGVAVLMLPEDLVSAELCLCSTVAQEFRFCR